MSDFEKFAMLRKDISMIIRSHMYRSGIKTIGELGKQAGIPRARLYTKMRGEHAFTCDELYMIARTLGVHMTDLLCWKEGNK